MEDLLSAEDIKEILQPYIETVKAQMHIINQTAINLFYGGGSSGTYNRSGGFNALDKEPDESWSKTKVTLLYTYEAGDVSVNPWQAPWKDTPYPGDSGWAFDTGFVNGLHGGPRPTRGGWSWAGVQQTPSPWERIVALSDSISI